MEAAAHYDKTFSFSIEGVILWELDRALEGRLEGGLTEASRRDAEAVTMGHWR
ncbi:hypothetical protein SAMN05660971_01240 [Halomonas cupida]|nr:hypothetical protein SAMN05660971_01240 [Halomonas cupida]